MRQIEWAPDGVDSLNEILEYYIDNVDEKIANNIYINIIEKINKLKNDRIRTKQCQELKDIGIFGIYEIVINPWKVYYKITEDNKIAYILFVLDARRNIEEVLISKVIDGKI